MGWLTLNKTSSEIFYSVMREVDEESSHRAIAIVSGAFVEDHLAALLQSRMVQDKKVTEEMFRPGGALGNFGPKISLGFLMGLYSDRARRELITIQSIRNDFAHKLGINDFNIEGVSQRCKNLNLYSEIKIKISKESGNEKLQKGTKLKVVIGRGVEPEEQELPIVDLFPILDQAESKFQYVAACKFFIAIFSILSSMERARPIGVV